MHATYGREMVSLSKWQKEKAFDHFYLNFNTFVISSVFAFTNTARPAVKIGLTWLWLTHLQEEILLSDFTFTSVFYVRL